MSVFSSRNNWLLINYSEIYPGTKYQIFSLIWPTDQIFSWLFRNLTCGSIYTEQWVIFFFSFFSFLCNPCLLHFQSLTKTGIHSLCRSTHMGTAQTTGIISFHQSLTKRARHAAWSEEKQLDLFPELDRLLLTRVVLSSEIWRKNLGGHAGNPLLWWSQLGEEWRCLLAHSDDLMYTNLCHVPSGKHGWRMSTELSL